MTFTGIPFGSQTTEWVEDGITARGDVRIGAFTRPDTVHLEGLSGPTPFGTYIDFTTGGLFEAVSVDLLLSGSGYCAIPSAPSPFGPSAECLEAASDFDDPIPYIGVTGFLDGVVVADVGFYRAGGGGAAETIDLALLGVPVDLLRLEFRSYTDLGLPNGSCDVLNGCGHFDVDAIRLRDATAPIPEPTAAIVFSAGLLFVARRLRSRSPAAALRDLPIEDGSA